ncbi:MAG: hypothetical protein EAZ62_07390 [Sphingobacteriia bacterium]|nr:MAG: hypothetical protein EAZ62_07390 [Sphingobacteriia bacterium]
MLPQRCIAFCLFLLLAAPFGRLSWIPVERWQIRHAQKEALESASLQSLDIPLSQLVWLEEGKEISWQGERFDVKTMQALPGNKVRLVGLFDQAEKALDHLLDANTTSSKGQQLFLHLLQLQSPSLLSFFDWRPIETAGIKAFNALDTIALLDRPHGFWVPPPAMG